jgi:hypothetical protein
MATSKYILTGQITRRDTGAGIHGLVVEAWDDDLSCDDCLGSDLTNRDGSFLIQFRTQDFKEKFEGKLEVYLKVFDRDCRLIYDTQRDKCACDPGEPLQFKISLVPDTLWWHFSRVVSWECPNEGLVPEKIIDEIEEAVAMLTPSIWLGRTAQLNAILSSEPPIRIFDGIVRDACETLQGNLEAAARYRDVLEALCVSQAGECCCGKDKRYHKIIKSIFHKEWPEEPGISKKCTCTHHEQKEGQCAGDEPGEKEAACPCKESLVSIEKATILITAALHIACGHVKTARIYLLALLDELCRFEYLGTLHRAAVNALSGDERALDHFRDLVEFIEPKCLVDEQTRDDFPMRTKFCCCEICLQPELEQCLRDAVSAWSQIACYTITEVRPARACPGEEIVICGNGFGDTAGAVLFRQKGSLNFGPKVQPKQWCDDKIAVTVPEQAGCGLVPELSVETVKICDKFLEYRPTGCIKKGFEGTSAEILKFNVKGRFDGDCVEPGKPLQIRWVTCAVDKVRVEIINEATNVVIASQNPADHRGIWDFTDTNFKSTTRVRVQITAEGQCQPQIITKHVSFVFQREPNLTVDGFEITQAIQYYRAAQHLTDPADRGPDNSLRQVTNKTAWVRAYLRSGQDPAFDNAQLANVDGTLTVERRVGGIWGVVTNIPSQNGPITAENSFANYDAERGNINNSLNFIVPANVMTGLLRFTVNIASEYPQCPGNVASGQISVDVNLTQTLNAAFITIGYNGPNATNTGNLVLPAPVLAQCQAETVWAMRTYPVSGAPNVRIAGTFTTNTPLNDPRSCPGCCSPNWGPLLQQVAILVAADQLANPGGNWVYYGLINNGIPVNVPGCSGIATGGLAGNQGGITYAHEIGHQFGLPHARCGNAGGGNPAYPVYEPYDLPVDPPGTTDWTMASIGEYGLDINNGNIANPNNAKDFMSYCGPRWISLFTYNFLVNRPGLVPQVIPTGSGAATNRMIRDEEVTFVRSENTIEPLIHILGKVDSEGNVEVTSLARLETRYLVGDGQPTDYLAQLLNEKGDIIAQDVLYRYESKGCNCGKSSGCHDESEQDKSFIFKAMLNDVAPGSRLRIVKGDEVVWERVSPPTPPKLTNVRASLDKAQNLRLTWRLEKGSEMPEDIWVRWSADEGQTWHALSVGLRGTTANIDLIELPSGDIVFQVMAHDGFYTVAETTKSIELPAKPPTVTIYYPKENDQVYAESRLHLWGMATSFMSGELIEEQFVWYIDEKEVGRGRDIWIENPGEGSHQVRLVVSDEGGESTASSSITIIKGVD